METSIFYHPLHCDICLSALAVSIFFRNLFNEYPYFWLQNYPAENSARIVGTFFIGLFQTFRDKMPFFVLVRLCRREKERQKTPLPGTKEFVDLVRSCKNLGQNLGKTS